MIWIWGASTAAYLAFRAWYDNWRGPLTAAEIEAFMARTGAGSAAGVNDLAAIRRFLEADDGREFFMLNLVKVTPGDLPDPVTGLPSTGARVLDQYTRPFVRKLIARGGHPAIAARKVGPYVDAWDTPPDPGWSLIGYMRYRSRRDMMILATDPGFTRIHAFKLAGIASTFSFPTRPAVITLMGPRLWVGLVLALVAALAQLALQGVSHS